MHVARRVRGADTAEDCEAVQNIVLLAQNLRPNLLDTYSAALAVLIQNHPDAFAPMAMRHFLAAEATTDVTPPPPSHSGTSGSATGSSNSSSNHNMKLLALVFRSVPSDPNRHLALALQDLAASATGPHDHPQQHLQLALRPLVRKVVRCLHSERLNLCSLCINLMGDREEILAQPGAAKERWISSLAEMVNMACMACAAVQRPETDDEVTFRFDVARVHAAAVDWCQSRVPRYFDNGISQDQFSALVGYLLLLKPIASYLTAGDSVTELEKSRCQYWLTDLPLQESTIVSIVFTALNMKLIRQDAALDMVKLLVRRACLLQNKLSRMNMPHSAFDFRDANIAFGLLRLAMYEPPLPPHATPPETTICVRAWLWESVILLLPLVAFAPAVFGRAMWELPTVRRLIEALVKGKIDELEKLEDEDSVLRNQNELILAFGREMLLLNEQHGLNIEIFNSTSSGNTDQWRNLFMLNDINANVRIPPADVINNIRIMDRELGLANSLRNSRDPDFLLDIMRSEGTPQSLEWLAEVLKREINTLAVLPMEVLCQVMMLMTSWSVQKTREGIEKSGTPSPNVDGSDREADNRLLLHTAARLSECLLNSTSDVSLQVLSFFIAHLSDGKSRNRATARVALEQLLVHQAAYSVDDLSTKMKDHESESGEYISYRQHRWLAKIPTIISWEIARPTIAASFSNCLQIENDIPFVTSYTQFVAHSRAASPLQMISSLNQAFRGRRYLMTRLFDSEHGASLYTLMQHLVLQALEEWRHLQQHSPMPDDASRVAVIQLPHSAGPQQLSLPRSLIEFLFHHLLAVPKVRRRQTSTEDPLLLPAFCEQVLDCLAPMQPPRAYYADTKRALVDSKVSLCLMRSKSVNLAQRGIAHAGALELVQALTTFGVTREIAKLIHQRIDTAVAKSDLETAVAHLQGTDSEGFSRLRRSRRTRGFSSQLRAALSESSPDERSQRQPIEKRESVATAMDETEDIAQAREGPEVCWERTAQRVLQSPQDMKRMVAHEQSIVKHLMRYLCTRASLSEKDAHMAQQLLDVMHDSDVCSSVGGGQKHVVLTLLHVLNRDTQTIQSAVYSSIITGAPLSQQKLALDSPVEKLLMSTLPPEAVSAVHLKRTLQQHQQGADDQNMTDEDDDDDGRGRVDPTVLHRLVRDLIRSGSTVGEDLFNTLLQTETGRASGDMLMEALVPHRINESIDSAASAERETILDDTHRLGLLVDHVSRLYPSVDHELLRESSIFGIGGSRSSSSARRFSRHLMSLLFENCSQSDVESFAKRLTSQYEAHEIRDTQSALSFMVTYLRRFTSANTAESSQDDLVYYDIDAQTAVQVVKLLVREVQHRAEQARISGASAVHELVMSMLHRKSRFRGFFEDLLLKVARYSPHHMHAAVSQLFKYIAPGDDTDPLQTHAAHELLIYLYARNPLVVSSIVSGMNQNRDFVPPVQCLQGFVEVDSRMDTRMDPVLHRISQIVSVCSNNPVTSFAFTVSRQLAYKHPQIVMRYLESLLVGVEDCSTMTMEEFLAKGLIWPYLRGIGLLHNLAPTIFRCPEKLDPILQRYFKLLGMIREHSMLFVGLVAKLTELVHEYMVGDDGGEKSGVVALVMRYKEMLVKLQTLYPEIDTIGELLKLVRCQRFGMDPRQRWENRSIVQSLAVMTPVDRRTARGKHATRGAMMTDVEIAAIRTELSRGISPGTVDRNTYNSMCVQQEGRALVDLLRDLHDRAQSVPSVLLPFVATLLQVVITPLEHCDDKEVKDLAYGLLIGCMQFDPATYSRIVPQYVKCLSHRHASIRGHALRFAVEMYPYCHEYSRDVLLRVFQQSSQDGAMDVLASIFSSTTNL